MDGSAAAAPAARVGPMVVLHAAAEVGATVHRKTRGASCVGDDVGADVRQARSQSLWTTKAPGARIESCRNGVRKACRVLLLPHLMLLLIEPVTERRQDRGVLGIDRDDAGATAPDGTWRFVRE